ncbi:MAG TPA: CHASE domain-containing protein [Geomonas sp.]|nr:CHASE domain-containing protein [Geomonas sp.]
MEQRASITGIPVPRSSWILWMVPLSVFLVVLTITLLGWRALDEGARLKARTVYQDKTRSIVNRLVDRWRGQEQLLLGGVGLFNAKGEVTRADWRRYVEALQMERNLPGILGMGYCAWFTPQEKPALEASVRQEGFPSFAVKPPGPRSVYTSIILLEPFNWRNQRAFGFDMYSETVRRAAMDEAINEGVTTITGKVILVQETKQEVQNGVLMYVPVFRPGLPVGSAAERRLALKGFVYSPVRMNDFVEGSLSSFPEDISFDIYDGDPKPANLLFTSRANVKALIAPDYRPALTSVRRVHLYGRTWTVTFSTLPPFDAQLNRGNSMAALIAGVLLSILSGLAAANLLATRERAVALARSMVQELQQSEERVSLILNSTAEAIYGIDTEGHCTFCNDACLRLLGYGSAEELLGRNMHSQIHHSRLNGLSFPEEECRIFRAVRVDRESHADDEVLWRADGSSFHAEYWSYPQRKEGKVVGAVVTFIDITDRKALEQELQKQAAMLEREVGERQRAQQTLAGHAAKLEQWNVTLGLRVREEVAKNREKDQKLIQQDKLASLGQLAAGVAHEINNPIGFISSNLRVLREYMETLRRHYALQEEILRREAPQGVQRAMEESAQGLGIGELMADVGDLVEESLEGATRVAKIVTDLKGFSRIDSTDREETDLTSCMESALSIAWNELKYVARVEKDYRSLPAVLCHPGQLNQVFMNLLVNAAQAISAPGVITLKTWCDAGSVYASVSDTGCGIAPDIMARIFEPFFTTKGVGKGTGLGLSISYDIIKKHHGELTVVSEPGRGTTFTVQLPRTGLADLQKNEAGT